MSDDAKNDAESTRRLSTSPSDASCEIKDLSKAAPHSRRARLRKRDKEPITQGSAPPIEVDVSANIVRITQGARIFGTNDYDSIRALVQQVGNVTPSSKGGLENLKSSIATVQGIAPRDPLEGLLVVQMIGVHNLAMECLKRASLKEQTAEGVDMNVHRAVRLLRTFTSQMEALNRNRGKTSQQMVVGNVNVSEGGQAIVGSVEHRDTEKAPAENDGKRRR